MLMVEWDIRTVRMPGHGFVREIRPQLLAGVDRSLLWADSMFVSSARAPGQRDWLRGLPGRETAGTS
jgi:hypothetical protein